MDSSLVKRNLTDPQRQAIIEILLKKQGDTKRLKMGVTDEVADLFSVSKVTIRRIWREAQANIENGLTAAVFSKRPGRVGRKRVEIDFNQVVEIPLRRRMNIRSFSKAINVPKSTLHRKIKEGVIRRHSNAMKPLLSEQNKKARLQFCLSMLDSGTLNDTPKFIDMHNYVHIDEKWFNLSHSTGRYYLYHNESEPLRTCKSKRFIPKIMFLAAVARPRFDAVGNLEFDGKIGIFPFIFKDHAKRNSKNRVAGTLETKAITSITKEVIRSCLIEKVLPAIRAKWPSCGSKTIFIQQDNARPHIGSNDVEFLEEASKDGFDIRLSFQPPNSPDMNILDLGFFRSIQSLQHQEAPSTIDELVNAVEKSFNALTPENLNNIFLTLQSCMVEVMKVTGGNNYKIPHIGKDRLVREGLLPNRIHCDVDVMNAAILQLQE